MKVAARSAAEDETTSAAAFPATLRLTTQRPLDGEGGGKKKNLVYNTHNDYLHCCRHNANKINNDDDDDDSYPLIPLRRSRYI